MNHRAYSLVEITVAAAIGLLVLGALCQCQIVASRQQKQLGRQERADTALNLAIAQVRESTRALDHGFWIEFPRSLPLVHPVDHLHGALQFSEQCPQHPDSACLTSFDIVPRREAPTLYTIVADDYPRLLRLAPLNGYTGDELSVRAGDVLYFTAETDSFCALVTEVLVDQIELAPGRDQPWALPDTLAPNTRVVGLGALTVRHLYLDTADEEGRDLVLEPWTLDARGWRAGRRGTLQGGLLQLLFLPCEAEQTDRLVFVGRIPEAPFDPEPLVIAGQVFSREVAHGTLEF